jgi:hypothetical protein
MTKLDLSIKQGTFVGFCESSKAYRIYIPGQRQIEVSRDVSFEKEVAFKRPKGSHMQLTGASRSAKRVLWPEDSLRWREWTMRRPLLMLLDIPPLRRLLHLLQPWVGDYIKWT